MNEKTKERLIAGGFIVTGIVVFYLLTRSQAVPAAGSNGLSLGGSTYGPPSVVNESNPGGLTYNVGGYQLPTLAQQGVPNIDIGGDPSGGGDCCCGCDANSSGVNGFAQSVSGALNQYATQVQGLETSTISSMYGNIPDFISQYVATADPNAPGSLNG